MSLPPAPQLRAPRHRVDPRARRWWTVQALVVVSGPMLLTALALGLCSALFFSGALPWLLPLLLVTLVVPALGYLVLMPRRRHETHAWELGVHAVYAAGGWMWQRRRIAPLSQVQTVDTVRGPLQRRYGLTTLTVTTASTAGDITIEGLSETDAEKVAQAIGRAAHATRAGVAEPRRAAAGHREGAV
ncbi:PH domain-containing protein [Streptomyces ficellus]|uniref:PH domain-containing protein n=1 Tax=Streptomyces ficellus TaxID=1977088 RepID=A0A6I6FGD2_9ACTN|nr:PH domain-containing protein [Streptomyces ficellus]QGV82374.1 PH domain-containing protein [Streptomyces ficellus]